MEEQESTTGQPGARVFIAALGAIYSSLGYLIANSFFLDTMVGMVAGSPRSAGYTELREAIAGGGLCCGISLLFPIAFAISFYLEDRMEILYSPIPKVGLILAAGMFLGLIVYAPFVIMFIFLYAV